MYQSASITVWLFRSVLPTQDTSCLVHDGMRSLKSVWESPWRVMSVCIMKYLYPLQLKWSTSFTTSSKESPLKTPWSVSLFSGNRTIPLTIFLPIDRLDVCQLWRWLILFSEFPSLIVVTTRAKFSLFREKKWLIIWPYSPFRFLPDPPQSPFHTHFSAFI